jgi:hypothetical protein
MRIHLEMQVYGVNSLEQYPDDEIRFFKVLSLWLRVHYAYYYYFEYDKNGEIVYDEQTTAVISIEAVTEIPANAVDQRLVYVADVEYNLCKTQLGAKTWQRVLRAATKPILGMQSPDYAEILI